MVVGSIISIIFTYYCDENKRNKVKLPVCTFNCSKLCEKLNKLHAAIIEINL